jgi:NADH-quinone oxidoreductase subunit J
MSIETALFYVAAAVSVASTALVITRVNAAHALMYLIVSLLSIAVIFFLLGAPFAAALEVIVYAGAIVVLFLFVVMMLNLGRSSVERERSLLAPAMWVGPGLLTSVLFVTLVYALSAGSAAASGQQVPPRSVGLALFGPYLLAVEMAGVLLLAALVGAFHLGRRYMRGRREGEA